MLLLLKGDSRASECLFIPVLCRESTCICDLKPKPKGFKRLA